MIQFPVAILGKLAKLFDNGAFRWSVCIEVVKGSAFYLTDHDLPISFLGKDWSPFPMELGEHKASGDGDLTTSVLTVSNIGRIAMPYLESGSWDQGVVIFQPVYVPSPDGLVVPRRIRYFINNASADMQAVTLNLGQRNVFARPYPARSYIRNQGFPGILRASQWQ